MCVLRVPGGTGYWGGWQVHYGVDRWLAVKLPRCYTNQLIDAKKKQARARLRYMPCRAAAANAWWHNLMRCHMVGPYALNAQTRRPQTRVNTVGALSVCLPPRSVGLYVCPPAVCLFNCLSACIVCSLSVCRLSACLSVGRSVGLSVCLSVCRSVPSDLSVCQLGISVCQHVGGYG